MGMFGLSTRSIVAVVAVLAVASGAVVASGGFQLSVGDKGDVNSEDGSSNLKSISESTVKMKTGSDGADTVYLFKKQPNAEHPVYYNDRTDFSASEATNNRQAGVDYYKVALDNATSTSSGSHLVIEPDRYHYAVVDQHGQVHNAFGTVDIESEVQEYKLDRNYQQLVTLPLDQQTKANSADVVTSTSVESGDATYSPDTSLRASGQSDFETVQTVTHKIDVQSGALYLGDIDLGTYTGANTTEAELVSAEVDGQSVDALSGIDLSDHNLDNNVFGASDDPMVAKDEVVLKFRFEVESDIQDGDSIASGINVQDIYNTATSNLAITG